MRSFVIILASALLFHPTDLHQSAGHQSVAEIVHSLGYRENPPMLEQLAILARSSPDSVFPLLISQLSLIKDATQISAEEMPNRKKDSHIIWCIRALRYLTDSIMTAGTTHRFGKDEHLRKYWVSSNRTGEFYFFGEWLSRGLDFIAPLDVQREIIEDWHQWYLHNKGHLAYHLNPDSNNWYWW